MHTCLSALGMITPLTVCPVQTVWTNQRLAGLITAGRGFGPTRPTVEPTLSQFAAPHAAVEAAIRGRVKLIAGQPSQLGMDRHDPVVAIRGA